MWDVLWSIRREGGIGGEGEDDRGLLFLARARRLTSPFHAASKKKAGGDANAHLAERAVQLFVQRSQA